MSARASECGSLIERRVYFFCTHVTFRATVFFPGEIGDEILLVPAGFFV